MEDKDMIIPNEGETEMDSEQANIEQDVHEERELSEDELGYKEFVDSLEEKWYGKS